MGFLDGMIGMGSKRRFSGLMSLDPVSCGSCLRYLPMHHAALLVQVANTFGDLANDVSGQGLRKVRELYNLVEKLATLHDCDVSQYAPLHSGITCPDNSRSRIRK